MRPALTEKEQGPCQPTQRKTIEAPFKQKRRLSDFPDLLHCGRPKLHHPFRAAIKK
jgi:hypothetical protein